jgi:3D-(3,5/4)-trihydroxycyclohexane-1,2-dione acylhydrolase (decyclizing)
LEYGYSCMGYEVAGALGAKLAAPEREVIAMLGDGSYLMLNSELATSVMGRAKIILVLLDNRGFGCINRLQQGTGGEKFNNLLPASSQVDFVAHAQSLGARAEKASSIGELEEAMGRALASPVSYVVVIDTDPEHSTAAGGAWWDVAVPEVSDRAEVQAARSDYEQQLNKVRP